MNSALNRASFRGDPPAAAQDSSLADRRELALVAFERTRMPMVVTDPRQSDNPIVLANQAFLDLTGYPANEVIGRNCRFLQGPGTAEQELASLREKLAGSRNLIEMELLNYRKDGSMFWNQLHIETVHAEDGELRYYFASQKDVTARRGAEILEASERRLLMEIDHRAMNALALVESIVSLSRADSAQGLSRSITGRIGAIAAAHRMLAREGWKGAELHEVLEGRLPSPPSSQVEMRGPRLALRPHVVQPLTLVLHEFVSNALRHGALSRTVGNIALSWKREDGGLWFFWSESGPALQAVAINEQFGLAIARNVVERQLNGKMTMHTQPGVLSAELAIPRALN